MPEISPDLLTMESGEPVSAATWSRRREELYAAIIPHEYGGMPPPGRETVGIDLGSWTVREGLRPSLRSLEVRTVFEDGRELSFLLRLWVPSGAGPFPVVLDGDGCWRYFDDRVIEAVLSRGNIAASFNRTAVAADNASLYRDTGLYRLFPEAEFGALAAWAWAYHRCVDVLTRLDFVRSDQIAVAGHSRGGKTVLLAGATDERIALVNPNNSGIGGSGLNHWKAAGSEVVDDFIRAGSIFWFGRGFAEYQGRDRELPYDQHFLHALVAPRGLLANEAYEDAGANPPGSYAACRAARPVFEMLGAPDGIGWALREGGHGHRMEDFQALLDFMDVRFHQRPVVRDFQRELFPRLEDLLREG